MNRAQQDADNEELRLRRDFAVLDRDGNGVVDRQEMEIFLREKGIDEDHRIQIIDVIFQNADLDGNNAISLYEFVKHYVDTKDQLVQREIGITQSIHETNKRLQEAKAQLTRAMRDPRI